MAEDFAEAISPCAELLASEQKGSILASMIRVATEDDGDGSAHVMLFERALLAEVAKCLGVEAPCLECRRGLG